MDQTNFIYHTLKNLSIFTEDENITYHVRFVNLTPSCDHTFHMLMFHYDYHPVVVQYSQFQGEMALQR